MQLFRRQIVVLIFLCQSFFAVAQQPAATRTQYPPGLLNSYTGVNIGAINYAFSNAQLEPGFTAQSVKVPHTAVRIILLGHQFNKYLSAQISYMRPVGWVEYKKISADQSDHTVWMNVAGLTLASQLPLHKKISLFGEAGLGIITRKGFSINNVPVVKNANYATLLAGAALQYHLNRKWDLQISSAWSPANQKVKQPATTFLAAGFHYHMRPLPKETVEQNANSGYIFPKQFIMAGYTTNGLGYGVNDFASKGAIPFFWGGEAHIQQGFTLSYQRNIFHTRKVFAFDWAAGISFWKSRDKADRFMTASLSPVFRFTAVRSKPLDFFFEYSVAGPTYISKKIIDDKATGQHFTFYDFMGMGAFTGKKRQLNANIRIAHYSNGNIYPQNDGLKIPLTFQLGYVF